MVLAVGSTLGTKGDLESQSSQVQAAPGDSEAHPPTLTRVFSKHLLQVLGQLIQHRVPNIYFT